MKTERWVILGFVVFILLALWADHYSDAQRKAECDARGGTIVQFDDDVDPVCWTPQMGGIPR